jgi:hypothetical protein
MAADFDARIGAPRFQWVSEAMVSSGHVQATGGRCACGVLIAALLNVPACGRTSPFDDPLLSAYEETSEADSLGATEDGGPGGSAATAGGDDEDPDGTTESVGTSGDEAGAPDSDDGSSGDGHEPAGDDDAPPAVCGNGVVEAGEACDGPSLGGETCKSLGFVGGPLRCDEACEFDTSSCMDAPGGPPP